MRQRSCNAWPLVALAAAPVLLGLAGCGQKGPLYLPDPAPQTVPPAVAPPPTAPVPPGTPAAADDAAAKRKSPPAPAPDTSQ
jgi:predicted small lipoprotein YifL